MPDGLQVKLGRLEIGGGSIRTRLIAVSVNLRGTINPLYIHERPRCTPVITVSRAFHLTDSMRSLEKTEARALYYPRGRTFARIYATYARQEHTFAREIIGSSPPIRFIYTPV